MRRGSARVGCLRLALVALLAGCASGSDRAGAGELAGVQQRLASVEGRLRSAIGNASCDAVAQCAAVAIGHKPCGGPAAHLAYSTAGTDVARVSSIAAEHRALAQRANTLRGAMSDCLLVEPPPLACTAGRCTFIERR